MILDLTWPNPQYDPKYEASPSAELRDALKLPLLFHAGGPWDDERRKEWLRVTGTREASTKVLCDHLRAAIKAFDRASPPHPDALKLAEALSPANIEAWLRQKYVAHADDRQWAMGLDYITAVPRDIAGKISQFVFAAIRAAREGAAQHSAAPEEEQAR